MLLVLAFVLGPIPTLLSFSSCCIVHQNWRPSNCHLCGTIEQSPLRAKHRSQAKPRALIREQQPWPRRNVPRPLLPPLAQTGCPFSRNEIRAVRSNEAAPCSSLFIYSSGHRFPPELLLFSSLGFKNPKQRLCHLFSILHGCILPIFSLISFPQHPR